LVGAVVFITDIQVNLVPLMRIFSCLSLFVGGIYGGLKAERAGWLHGALVGLIYFIVFSRFAGDDQIVKGVSFVGRGALCVVASTIGGIIGVNLQER
jgi:putative membrane protein (TIGR04086 family)